MNHLEGDSVRGTAVSGATGKGNRQGEHVKEAWFSPLVLRHCFGGSGASWARSGSADSAVAGDGCGTGGGAAQHLRLDPFWGKRTEARCGYSYGGELQRRQWSKPHAPRISSIVMAQHLKFDPVARRRRL